MRTVPPFAFCYSFFSPVGIAELYTRPGSGSACRRRGHPRPIAVPRPSPRDPLISNFLLACRRASFSLDKSLQKILEQVCNRLTASRSHREMTVCTARRRGVPFVRTKGTKIRSRGTDSPLTNPFLSLAVLDTNDAEASSVLRTDTLPR